MRQEQETCDRNRNDEYIDEYEVGREQPRCATDFRFGVVLDDRDVELARQEDNANEAQQRHRHPRTAARAIREDARDFGVCADMAHETRQPTEHRENHEQPDGQEGRELDERLRRDRQHQAVLVLRRIDMARTEKNGEGGECERDDEGRVEAEYRQLFERRRAEQRFDRDRRGLELECDVGKCAQHRDDGRDRRNLVTLAVTCGDEVGDRCQILTLCDPNDAQDQRDAEHEHQDRSEIDRNEIIAAGRGEPDAAEERPGRAVDRQRQGIGDRSAAATLPRADHAVAEPGHGKEQADISQRQRQNLPGFDHSGALLSKDSPATLAGHLGPSCFGPARRATEPLKF